MAAPTKQSKRFIYYLATILTLAAGILIAHWAAQGYRDTDVPLLQNALMVGIAAQLVDGALGMAYGVTATTFLLSIGVPPALATASVHIAEIFTTAASGLSHWHKGNINKKLFMSLLIPGTVGGLAGVAVVVNVDGSVLKPWMAGYLLVMGLYIIYKALKHKTFWNKTMKKFHRKRGKKDGKIVPLALAGGFLDSVGGGGWGPLVTTTLLGSGHEPKTAIGSVNAAEFFITVATGFSFAVFIGVAQWEIPAGLIVGGVITAPIAAHITSRLPTKVLMVFIGVLISSLSAVTIYRAIF
jgi:uncharacterized membrane protein YfcA